ncbi:MAG: hypothetical protein Q7J34_12680 [Bacteroidales bacterium]|jgi:carbon monoxide dehydrogenase subunit G|nr:hypothetical protein [Bacteroidales bacterium]
MTIIESKIQQTDCNAQELYVKLSDFNQFREVLPEQVENFISDTDTCSFTIKGMADVSLRISEKIPNSKVSYSNIVDKPFPFSLVFNINQSEEDSKCTVQVSFHGELNPMLAMMAKGPLTHFVNSIAEKIAVFNF